MFKVVKVFDSGSFKNIDKSMGSVIAIDRYLVTCVNQKRDGTLEPVLRKRLVDGLQHFQLRVPVQTVPAFDLISKLCVGLSKWFFRASLLFNP